MTAKKHLRDRLAVLDSEIGQPLTKELVDRIYKAADIIEAQEATIYALFDVAEDAIRLMQEHDPAAAARAARSLQSERDAARARQLRADGQSVSQIGLTMAREKDRPRPYDASQVRRWLRKGQESRTD